MIRQRAAQSIETATRNTVAAALQLFTACEAAGASNTNKEGQDHVMKQIQTTRAGVAKLVAAAKAFEDSKMQDADLFSALISEAKAILAPLQVRCVLCVVLCVFVCLCVCVCCVCCVCVYLCVCLF